MAITSPPLDWRVPIVDTNGAPTAAFQRLWEALNNLAASSVNSSGSSSVAGTNFRNRLINGDMVIDQRNNGSSVAVGSASVYSVDRWPCSTHTGATATVQRVANTSNSVGSPYWLKWTTGTAHTPGASDIAQVVQTVEGTNMADLQWGTAGAKPVTLSFWVQSSLTGTFAVSLVGASNAGATLRTNVGQYTINSANTPEYKTVTFLGDTTTNTYPVGNIVHTYLVFDMGCGTNAETTAPNAWTLSNVRRVASNVKITGTTGATWQITEAQLEVGASASVFERLLYDMSFARCLRYYWAPVSLALGIAGTATVSASRVGFPVIMRATPTIVVPSFTVGTGSAGTPAVTGSEVSGVSVYNSAGNWTVGTSITIPAFTASAEL